MSAVRRRGPVAICVVAVLAFAASALAAGHLVVTGHDWGVGIADGPTVPVAPGGTYRDCTSKPIADLSVRLVFENTPVGRPWSFRAIGPPIAGRTPWSFEGDFNLRKGTATPNFIPLTFPSLKKDGVSDFPPGTYRFELEVGHTVKLDQTITIVKVAGC